MSFDFFYKNYIQNIVILFLKLKQNCFRVDNPPMNTRENQYYGPKIRPVGIGLSNLESLDGTHQRNSTKVKHCTIEGPI